MYLFQSRNFSFHILQEDPWLQLLQKTDIRQKKVATPVRKCGCESES